ncbi:MAG: AAA family ATPase [Solirubrobacteraceae bacterium]|nr:AAA family ATPase [Solirubrobacteraceae bacterium]
MRRDPPSDTDRGLAADLLGRGAELQRVDALLERVPGGDGDALLISGDVGIGKTAFLDAVRTRAAGRGLRILRARGTELEQGFGFGAARQLLEPLLRDDADLWAGSAALARRVFDDGEPERGDGDRFARLQGLYWLVANAAEQLGPMLLVVDDAHWLDEPSAAFLNHLALRLDGLPVGLIVGTRPLEGLDLDSPLHELAAGVQQLRLQPLRPEDVGEYVERAWGAPTEAFAEAVHQITGGVPLLLREFLIDAQTRIDGPPPSEAPQDLARIGPRTIAVRVQRELRRSPAESMALARAVAVLGDDVAAADALALAGVDGAAASEALHPLLAGGVLAESDERGLHFVHPVVRTAVYASLDGPERGALHRRAAERLRDGDPSDARIAIHLLESAPAGDDWAVDALRAAAGRAGELGNSTEATRLLRRAIDERPAGGAHDAGLQWALAHAESNAGVPGALDRYAGALDLAGDDATRLAIARDYAGAMTMAARTDDAFALLDDHLGPLGDALPEDAAAGLHAVALFARSPRALAFREAQVQGGFAAGAGPEAGAVHAYEGMIRGRPSPSLQPALDAAFGGNGFPAELAASPAYGYGVLALICTDRLDRALSELDRSGAAALAGGATVVGALIDCLRGYAFSRQGRLVEAEAAAQQSLARADVPTWRFGRVAATVALVESLVEQGRIADARAAVDAVPAEDLAVDSNVTDWFVYARALLLLAEDRAPEAAADCLALGGRLVAWGAENPALVPWRSTAAHALAETGERERALELATEELAAARQGEVDSAIARALLAAGLVGPVVDEDALREAAATANRAGARLLEAQALVALGRARRIAGQRVEARETLREGLALAHRCGARRLADSALDELTAAGGKPRTREAAGVAALTASEARVARLAAGGKTNREIAQALYVTQKTVEMHLHNVYRKLDIPGRAYLGEHLD